MGAAASAMDGGFDLPLPNRPAPNPNSGRNFYAILGLERTATEAEIRKGYRKAAVKYHPDKWSTKPESEKKAAEEKFKDAAEAYEVLSDKDKKEVYDRYGEDGLKAGGGAGPSSSSMAMAPMGGMGGMGGFPGGVFMSSGGPGVRVSFTSFGGSGMSGSRAEQIFAAFFGGGDPFAAFDDDDDDDFFPRRAPPRPKAPPLRADLLPRESRVKLVGLSSESLNDSIGEIAGFDEEKKRYTVRLVEGGNEVAVKPLNVRQLIAGARIETATAVKFGFAAGVTGTAVYDTQLGKYIVKELSPRSGDVLGVKVKPENMILPADTRVTAVGLNSRPELNGKAGRVVSSDGGERYVVEMAAGGEQLKLKYGNVVALHGYNPYVGEFG